jgi:hypothetical protein
MTLNASGNLSIGNTNDTFKLDVTGTGRYSGLVTFNNSVNNNYLAFNHAGVQTWNVRISTANTSSFVIRNDYAGGVNVLTLAETGAATFSSSVRATGLLIGDDRLYMPGNQPISNWFSSSLTAGYSSSNSYAWVNGATNLVLGTDGNERMRITSGGLIFMNNLGGYSGSYADVRYDTSSKELFYQTSSLRYKEDINNLENTLSKINQLRAVRYKDIKTQKYNCGFIAEEVINIIPEVVFKKEVDGELKTEGINYSDFTPFIIKALQEQQAQINDLKSQLNK